MRITCVVARYSRATYSAKVSGVPVKTGRILNGISVTLALQVVLEYLVVENHWYKACEKNQEPLPLQICGDGEVRLLSLQDRGMVDADLAT